MKTWLNAPENRLLERVLNSCRDLIYVKNDKFEIVYGNQAMLNLFAPEVRSRVFGSTMLECFTAMEASQFLMLDREALDNGFAQTTQDLTDYRGRKMTLEMRKTRFVDSSQHVRILCIATDITEMVEQRARLAASDETLARFAALTAHDLSSPIATASLMVDILLAKEGGGYDSDLRGALTDIQGVLQGSCATISSILMLQKALSGGELEKEETDLGEVVHSVERKLRALLFSAQATIVYGNLPVISCNPTLVATLIQNLFENSLKYKSKALPVIKVDWVDDNNGGYISVSDNGQGMKRADTARMFQAFVQGDPQYSGIGIGLNLCKGVVEAHGGRIWIDHTYSAGTRINFTLSPHVQPAQQDTSVAASLFGARGSSSDIWLHNKKSRRAAGSAVAN